MNSSVKRFCYSVMLFAVIFACCIPFGLADDEKEAPSGTIDIEYDGEGGIDRIEYTREIVINDRYFKLAYNVRYYSEDNKIIGSGYFVAGKYIKYKLNSRNEVQKIWRARPPLE